MGFSVEGVERIKISNQRSASGYVCTSVREAASEHEHILRGPSQIVHSEQVSVQKSDKVVSIDS